MAIEFGLGGGRRRGFGRRLRLCGLEGLLGLGFEGLRV